MDGTGDDHVILFNEINQAQKYNYNKVSPHCRSRPKTKYDMNVKWGLF
jgi:hypothetical protein